MFFWVVCTAISAKPKGSVLVERDFQGIVQATDTVAPSYALGYNIFAWSVDDYPNFCCCVLKESESIALAHIRERIGGLFDRLHIIIRSVELNKLHRHNHITR
jgi:hypothetical protein